MIAQPLRQRHTRPATASEGEDAVAVYLREISGAKLLTAAEEVQLAQAIEHGHAASQKLEDEDAGDVEQAALVLAGRAAAERLAASNLRLVVSVARRYLNRGLPLSDVIQEGNLGLLHAVEHFDWHRGFRFSTYATWWIRQSIRRGIDNHGRTIRLPAGVAGSILRLARTRADLYRDLEREPTDVEIGTALGLTAERVQELQRLATTPVSFDLPIGENGDTVLADLLCDEGAVNGADQAVAAAEQAEIAALLGTLAPREQLILERRFGFGGQPAQTLIEIGQALGLTRERVRQIESTALRKLRHPSRLHQLSACA
jgi:RNA polymerase primary sigma factor